jgi:hypothetical protein
VIDSHGYSPTDPTKRACKGGVTVLPYLHPKFQSLVIDNDYCANDRAAWIRVSNIACIDFGVMCIYASNVPREIMELWD